MRILFLTTKFDYETGGGSTPELVLKIRAMRELGHDVKAVTLFPGINRGGLPQAFPVIEERINTSGQLAIQFGVHRILQRYEHAADAFHVDGSVFLYGAGYYRLRGGKVPVVAHFNRELSSFAPSRTPPNPFSFLRMFRALRRCARYASEKIVGSYVANHIDRFTFTSPLLRDLYMRFGLREDRSIIIRDFIDAEQTLGYRRPSVPPPRPFTIVSSGRMIWEKGFDLILKAVARLQHRNEVRVMLSGDGPEADALKKLAADLGIAHLVQFPGWVVKEKLFEFLRAAHLFILPRWRPELASMLVFEAMGVGVPVLLPGRGTLAWSAGDAAMTFEDQNVADLAEKIELLRRDDALRNKLIEHGFARVRELDYREPAKKLDEIFREIA